MTTKYVDMQKDGETIKHVHEAQVAAHEALGWSVVVEPAPAKAETQIKEK